MAASQLTATQLSWLARLPTSARGARFELWHASAEDPLTGRLSTEPEAAAHLARQHEPMGLIGHTHRPMIARLQATNDQPRCEPLAGDYPECHRGRPPRNKGLRYPANPPTVDRRPSTVDRRPSTVEEIIAVMRTAGDNADGVRPSGLIVVLWRAGLRISEALALAESELDPGRGAILVRYGKGGKRREVGMDRWGWEQLAPWLTLRSTLPV